MKKLMKIKVSFCDVCKKQDRYLTKCLKCGKELCFVCKQTGMVFYSHAVNFAGSRDGNYCNECDAWLTADGKNNLHLAFRAIRSLKLEESAWCEDFRKRQAQAEKHLKSIPRPEE